MRKALALLIAVVGCGGSVGDPSQEAAELSQRPAVSLTAAPAKISAGGTAQLLPQFTAGTGSVSPDVGAVASGQAVAVQPSASTTYTLTVRWRNRHYTANTTIGVASGSAPAGAPAGIVIYDDAMAPGWQDWSWATDDLANASPVSSGARSISVSYGPWTGLSFFLPGGVSGAADGTLEFDVNGGATSNPAINAMVQAGGTWGAEVPIAPYCGGGSVPAGAFTHCKVPLKALGAANVTFERVALKEALGRTLPPVYFDQLSIVPPPAAPVAIQSFTASPPLIGAGGAATLAATYSGGSGSIDPGVGPIASGATVTVSPAATTKYTLTVSDGAGHDATSALTVQVAAQPSSEIVVYDDALSGAWQDWSWVTADLANASPVGSGARSISVFYQPWAGLSFYLPGGVSGAGAGTLEFDVDGGATANPAITAMAQAAGTWGAEVPIAQYCDGGSIPAGAFTHCKVPLAALGVAGVTFERIALKEAAGQTLPAVYFDQIAIVGESAGVPLPAIQSFTATPPAISAGGSATLTANYSGGTGTIDQGVGAIASGASVTVTPAATTTYTLTVSDGAGHSVSSAVTVQVNPLPAIQSFTAAPSAISVGGTATLTAIYSGGTGSIDQGVGAIGSVASITVTPAATTTYTLTVSDGAGHSVSSAVTVQVNPLPAIQSFTATPSTISAGSSAILAASYTGGTGTIDGGVGPIASGGSVIVTPAATTTYTLTVSDGAGHSVSGAITVQVNPLPAIQSFTATPSAISAGGSATLSASYSGGIGTIDRGVGAIASGGSVTVTPAATTTYTLTVSDGAGHNVTRSVTVQVNPLPAIQSFSANPSTIAPGDRATLSATYSGGTGTIDQGVGAIASGGSVAVTPAATTTYTLTVSDGAGHSVTASATVTVNPLPAIQSFAATPSTISAGDSATLSATYSGGTGTIDQGVGPIASGGSVSVRPSATTTYTLTVSDGAGHNVTRSVTVQVNPLPAIQSFTAMPSSIAAGGIAMLAATYSNGTGTIDHNVGPIASGSSVTVTPSSTTTYTLTVSDGAGHSVTGSVTVNVTPLPQIQSFSAQPSTIAAGGSATLAATYSGGTGTIDQGVGPVASGGSVAVSPAATTTYTLTVSDGAGHTATATASVTVTSSSPGVPIPAERLTVWNPGIPGGVPSRTTICANLSSSTWGNGAQDATAGIQAALDACPEGQVVQLSAGDYKITSPLLMKKGIVLRGAGPTQTKLKMPVGTSWSLIVLGTQWGPKFTQSVNLATDAVKGANSVTLASNPGLAVGELVAVDQITDTSLTEWNPTRSPPGDVSRTWFTRPDRPIGQILEVQSVSGNAVTFTTPFHITFRTASTAQLSRFSDVAGGTVRPVVKYAGIEDLYVYGGGDGNIRLTNAAYSWIRNVESDFQKGESVAIDGSFRCIIRDSYIHSTQDPNPGGGGYGFSFSYYSSDNLLENNISWNMNKVMVMRASGGGNVIGYNYMEDGWISYATGFVEVGLNASHMTTPHYELFEGNESFNFDGDNTWGNAIYITAFRNHLTGKRRSIPPLNFVDQGNPRAIGLGEGHWWYSFVGNVLGTENQNPSPNASYTYETFWPWNDNPVGMWRLGYNNDNWSAQADPKVTSTIIREGNFDYVTNQVHWSGTAQSLPPSLYLSSKPAFFGSNPWPWVDASGVVKLGTLPARARFDALHP